MNLLLHHLFQHNLEHLIDRIVGDSPPSPVVSDTILTDLHRVVYTCGGLAGFLSQATVFACDVSVRTSLQLSQTLASVFCRTGRPSSFRSAHVMGSSDSEATASPPQRPVKLSKQTFLQQRQLNHIDSSGSDDSNSNIAASDPENDVVVRAPRFKLPWTLVTTTVRVCRTYQYVFVVHVASWVCSVHSTGCTL